MEYSERIKIRTHPRSCSALFSREYKSLTPLDALFAIACADVPTPALVSPNGELGVLDATSEPLRWG